MKDFIDWEKIDKAYFIKDFDRSKIKILIRELPLMAIPILLKILKTYKGVFRKANRNIPVVTVMYLASVTIVNPNLRLFRNYLMFCKVRNYDPFMVLHTSSEWRNWKMHAAKIHYPYWRATICLEDSISIEDSYLSKLQLWMKYVDPDYTKMKNPLAKSFLRCVKYESIINKSISVKNAYTMLKKQKVELIELNPHAIISILGIFVFFKNNIAASNIVKKVIDIKPVNESLHDAFLPFYPLKEICSDSLVQLDVGYTDEWCISMLTQALNTRGSSMAKLKLKEVISLVLNMKLLSLNNWKVTDKHCVEKAKKIIQVSKYSNIKDNSFAKEASMHELPEVNYSQYENIWIGCLDALNHQEVPAPGGIYGVSSGNVKLFQMDKTDPRAFFIGEYTGCCQNIYGAGRSTVISTVSHPHSALWVVTVNNTIVAQSFVWVDIKKGALILDNIEAIGHESHIEKIVDVFYEALKSINGVFGITKFYQGSDSNDIYLYSDSAMHQSNQYISKLRGVYSDAQNIIKLNV